MFQKGQTATMDTNKQIFLSPQIGDFEREQQITELYVVRRERAS
jgi:hypothetical protein